MLQVLKMVQQIEIMDLRKETIPSKYAGLGAALAAELMLGFWFGIGVILAVGVVHSLNYCAGAVNEVTTTKMEGPGQVMTKDSRKVTVEEEERRTVTGDQSTKEWNHANFESI